MKEASHGLWLVQVAANSTWCPEIPFPPMPWLVSLKLGLTGLWSCWRLTPIARLPDERVRSGSPCASQTQTPCVRGRGAPGANCTCRSYDQIQMGVVDIYMYFGAFCQGLLGLENFLPTDGFSTKPLKVRLLAGEQKATEYAPTSRK